MFEEKNLQEILSKLEIGLTKFRVAQEISYEAFEALQALLEHFNHFHTLRDPIIINTELLIKIDYCILQYFALLHLTYNPNKLPLFQHYFACRQAPTRANEDFFILCEELLNPDANLKLTTKTALFNLIKKYGNYANCDKPAQNILLSYLKIHIQQYQDNAIPLDLILFFNSESNKELTILNIMRVIFSLEIIRYSDNIILASTKTLEHMEGNKNSKELLEPELLKKITSALSQTTQPLDLELELILLSYLTYTIEKNDQVLLKLFFSYVKKFNRQELLNKKIPHYYTKMPCTLLHPAILYSPLPIVLELLELKADPSIFYGIEYAGGLCALGLALWYREDEAINVLLKYYPRAKLTFFSKFGTYPHLLAQRGSVDFFTNKLQRTGVSLLEMSFYKLYCLKLGIDFRNEKLEKLTTNQFIIYQPGNAIFDLPTPDMELCGKKIPFYVAKVISFNPDWISYLETAALNCNVISNAGFLPLTLTCIAATNPTIDQISMKLFITTLLKSSAQFSTGKIDEIPLLALAFTPAEISTLTNILIDPAIRDYLIKNKPQTVLHEYQQQTFPYFSWVHFLAYKGALAELKTWLEQYPQDIALVDGDGNDILHYAVMTNQTEVVKFLFNKYPALTITSTIHSYLKAITEPDFTQFKFKDNKSPPSEKELLEKLDEIDQELKNPVTKLRVFLLNQNEITALAALIKNVNDQKDQIAVILRIEEIKTKKEWVILSPEQEKKGVLLSISGSLFFLEIMRQNQDIRTEAVKLIDLVKTLTDAGNTCAIINGENKTLLAILEYSKDEIIHSQRINSKVNYRNKWITLFNTIIFDNKKPNKLNSKLGSLYFIFKIFYEQKWPEIYELLLKHDEFKKFKDKGNTLLHLAVIDKNKDLLNLFLKAGVDPTIKNDKNQTAAESTANEELKLCFQKATKEKPAKKTNIQQPKQPQKAKKEKNQTKPKKDNQNKIQNHTSKTTLPPEQSDTTIQQDQTSSSQQTTPPQPSPPATPSSEEESVPKKAKSKPKKLPPQQTQKKSREIQITRKKPKPFFKTDRPSIPQRKPQPQPAVTPSTRTTSSNSATPKSSSSVILAPLPSHPVNYTRLLQSLGHDKKNEMRDKPATSSLSSTPQSIDIAQLPVAKQREHVEKLMCHGQAKKHLSEIMNLTIWNNHFPLKIKAAQNHLEYTLAQLDSNLTAFPSNYLWSALISSILMDKFQDEVMSDTANLSKLYGILSATVNSLLNPNSIFATPGMQQIWATNRIIFLNDWVITPLNPKLLPTTQNTLTNHMN